jgi:hypothetical protein
MRLRSHTHTGRRTGEGRALLSGKPVVRKVRRVQGVAPRPCLGGLMFGHTCLRRDRRLAEGGCCDV